jgi:proline dehydrogenase
MESAPKISFDNTAIAFHYKSNNALRKAHFIFSLVNHPWVSFLATGFVRFALKTGLPIEGVIRRTAFDHFCGGESIEESDGVIRTLADHNVQTILDYSVEGEKTETGFDNTLAETLRIVAKARNEEHIPFAVFKVTGLGSFELLEKVQRNDALSLEEQLAFERVRDRMNQICQAAFEAGVPVLIDAEESWIQDTIDALANEMMELYNKERALIFNTYQLYRTETLKNLKDILQLANRESFFIGAKLVRGAYMEKERERAEKMGYPSPIQRDKSATDSVFNDSLLFCLDNISRISLMCGSHNEYSNYFLTEMMEKRGIRNDDPRVWFGQLYGMSDNISFNLAKAGYNVAKYVPYGPVKAVMPYLFRRAQENTSVAGQSSRELTLIRAEVRRRKQQGGPI